jgi:hypothetical protein
MRNASSSRAETFADIVLPVGSVVSLGGRYITLMVSEVVDDINTAHWCGPSNSTF